MNYYKAVTCPRSKIGTSAAFKKLLLPDIPCFS